MINGLDVGRDRWVIGKIWGWGGELKRKSFSSIVDHC
jgi:hypothetical protein